MADDFEIADTELEQALDHVLHKAGVPMRGMPAGGDRGDLASDLADAVRRWLKTPMENEDAERLVIRALVVRHLDLYLDSAAFKVGIDTLVRGFLPALVDGLAMRAEEDRARMAQMLDAYRDGGPLLG